MQKRAFLCICERCYAIFLEFCVRIWEIAQPIEKVEALEKKYKTNPKKPALRFAGSKRLDLSYHQNTKVIFMFRISSMAN